VLTVLASNSDGLSMDESYGESPVQSAGAVEGATLDAPFSSRLAFQVTWRLGRSATAGILAPDFRRLKFDPVLTPLVFRNGPPVKKRAAAHQGERHPPKTTTS
jgi:hypothetical protein